MKTSMQLTFKTLVAAVTLTSAMLLASTAAMANDETGEAVEEHDWFARIDSNNDGFISESEFVANAIQRTEERATSAFARMDEDGNGEISADDFNAMIEKRGEWTTERRQEMRERMREWREEGHPRGDKHRGERDGRSHRQPQEG